MKPKMMKAIYVTAMMLFFTISMIAQNGSVGINNDGSNPNASAMLDVSSTEKGFLPPRMTTAQRNAISLPVAGLVIFNTDEKALNIYNGASWGLISPIVCGQPFTDPRDDKVYTAVQIGAQCWMKENLNVGTKIAGTVTQTNNGALEKYCYDNIDANCGIYGGLYQWDEAMQYSSTPGGQGICLTGWHLPTDEEWTTLISYLGGIDVAGGKLKETGYAHWIAPNAGADNSSGFTALPGGVRDLSGSFADLSDNGGWWSSSWSDASNAWHRGLISDLASVLRYNYNKPLGFSVRCIKN
ncbi:MAG: fibrobacter succinogenes major paralogous domain-containing protein [Bacteroidetes bacterium]|nr:fibrobacter succinogenes major paralogous domain-containing protein [Bacteroidota bacterium]